MNNKKLGLSAFENYSDIEKQFQNLGNSLLEKQSTELATQLQVFQNALINYSKEHHKEIVENPKFRSEFSKICSSFGVNPLVGNSSNNEELSNIVVKNDEFYFELAIKIIETCNETKNINGGIIKMKELKKLLNLSYNMNSLMPLNFKISESDIIKSIGCLKTLGDELKIIQIGSKNYIKVIPQALNKDENLILETCNFIGGYVSVALLRDNFQWEYIRCKSILDDMVSNGLLWIDEQGEDGEILYWEPSWIHGK
ncbi:hypothetical protein PACTADRAFT_1583 [Pachysolen tannophilus NRRL Y-2460]|uniref:Vacuolar-sorting protein SNF8 n=1 Tax=Pachysolen tannophilus NRRL Y-2460 TaxID=669874 RepID=A0A1E4TZ29_PACTA|nr:hypothetical protein PACTADRAFT_1583 [Pachysolen tannophilus NRRL Y-2460]